MTGHWPRSKGVQDPKLKSVADSPNIWESEIYIGLIFEYSENQQ